MNDTNITPRQNKILDLLAQKPFSRDEIEKKLNQVEEISKVTVLRNLNDLIDKNLLLLLVLAEVLFIRLSKMQF